MATIQAKHELEITAAPIRTKDGAYIGEIRTFGSPVVPDNWLECNGNAYKIKQYPDLAKVIGNLWGSVTKDEFLVPDLRGTFLRGWNHGRAGEGADPDANKRKLAVGAPGSNTDVVGSYQMDEVGEHTHTISLGSKWGDKGTGPAGWAFDDGNAGTSSISTPPRNATETRSKNAYVMFCIRAK